MRYVNYKNTLMDGIIIAVNLSSNHSFCKSSQKSIKLIAGMGVEDDAHSGLIARKSLAMLERPNLCHLFIFDTKKVLFVLKKKMFARIPKTIFSS